ncbi:MAG: B12-binding domain-containing radical SAM protein [Spirochaetia bacterium]|nr:B12-binding domain-containing radical SAM protein [Spirochaetia bacterium]
MKILLVAVNASYMHTSLAIRSISNYLKSQIEKNNTSELEVYTEEFTINQPYAEILRKIADSNADVVVFSTYIWNTCVIEKIIPDVKKVLDVIIGAGGPEFSYAPEVYFSKLKALDFIVNGEGEITCWDFFSELSNKGFSKRDFSFINFINIPGLYFYDRNQSKVITTGLRDLISDLDTIPFCYPELLTENSDPDHKIYYFESSRGCPYSCSYCLSSVDKSVRFKSIEKVFAELKIFLDADVGLVKFVDRTYNLQPDRYISIWNFILNNHNGKTMFHFEIEAEFLTEEALEFLQKVPKGIMQFEIGVQSCNEKTLLAIHRSPNVERLAQNVKRIPSTIHQHLDLIAGLPYEDLAAFGLSYDFVMALKPDALQLGFLKILHGTDMEKYAKENGWKWQENAVYETFSTPYMSFKDIMYLKDVEVLTDAFWNKHNFNSTCKFLFRFLSPWKFITELCDFCHKQKTFEAARRDLYWYDILFNFFEFARKNVLFMELNQECYDVLYDTLRYDFVSSGKKGNFPQWYHHRYDKDKHRNLLQQKGLLHSTRLAFALTEFEVFDYDIRSDEPEKAKGNFELLITYNG